MSRAAVAGILARAQGARHTDAAGDLRRRGTSLSRSEASGGSARAHRGVVRALVEMTKAVHARRDAIHRARFPRVRTRISPQITDTPRARRLAPLGTGVC